MQYHNDSYPNRYLVTVIQRPSYTIHRVYDANQKVIRYMMAPLYLPELQRYIDLGCLMSQNSETVQIFGLWGKDSIDSGWPQLHENTEPPPPLHLKDLFHWKTIDLRTDFNATPTSPLVKRGR